MKRSTILLSALALVGSVACNKAVHEEVSPFYDPETNEVVTDFVFNVATSPQTRQSSGAVQASASDAFRGISNAQLMSYSLETAGKTLAADATADKVYDLATVLAPGTLGENNSRRVLEMSLPLRTNTLLFYGKAPYGDAYGGFSNVYDCYGHMDAYSIGSAAGSTSFQIGSRLSDENYVKLRTVENMIAGIETLLLNHFIPAGTVISAAAYPAGFPASTYGYTVTIPTGGIYWSMYDDASGNSPIDTGHDRHPLEDKLRNLYRQLTTIRSAAPPEGVSELRAASGEAVLRMAKDLLMVLDEIRLAQPTCEAETVAKYLANEVYTRMTTKYYIVSREGESIGNVSFAEQSTIANAILSDEEQAYKPTGAMPADFAWPTAAQIQAIADIDPLDFPFNFNLPRGATHIAYDAATRYFYYPQTFNTSDMGGAAIAGDTYNAKSYYYPAELMYFGNSPIRTSSVDKKTSDYPNGSGQAATRWENDASWSADWNGNQVSSSTRSVAMKYDIQYGTAMLSTRVKYSSEVAGNLYLLDNNHAVQKFWNPSITDTEEPDHHIPVSATSFKVTGLLIGGQPKAVGWDYLPVKVDGSYKFGFVYDKAIPAASQAIPVNGASEPNYTMVLDNFLAAGESAGIYTPAEHQSKVYIAVEFLNNTGSDFYGNGNLIRDGGYFYIIGCLDPAADGLAAISWPTDRPVPPYKADGSSQEVTRVFIQDFMTKVTFTLGPKSLQSAYLTVPDLRSSSMSLGLSVDLNWETGLDFGEVILGGN